MARASGGCARAISNPARGGVPGQATRYIGALHHELLHIFLALTTSTSEILRNIFRGHLSPVPRLPTSHISHLSNQQLHMALTFHRLAR